MQLPYLSGYPDHLLEQVRTLIREQRLGPLLAKRYPQRHTTQSDAALRDYTMDLKARYLKSSSPLSKVVFDGKINIIKDALGLHSYVSRVQGNRLKAKNEIRIAALFKEAPPEFLEMIVVHELAHLREKDHNKAFYQLCCHMCPHYHQWEFDMRLWLTWRDLDKE
ncbi:YgjP-like metallopeptidase domain-containing protein [Aeromonas simiae]|uniref:YgjP-like metallopeptidase domain-containing protein n=1 Tax=Aeromonas simiae TaxID=218936 RepID=UPI00266D9908|nr:M48 family metallopeptidase [Aeromonas simiae]MDO2948550.1 M48 family metallopeptidase [Aeromonas simiae]MDO2951444.1 M48 family metallopeptidase [Aeromonas simiae]MDO2955933.1 M48 family metallopeptidase [Aeromonas simiae]